MHVVGTYPLRTVVDTEPSGTAPDLRQSKTAPWDIAPCAPYAWALLADDAMKGGDIERSAELIEIAYMAYDMGEANQ